MQLVSSVFVACVVCALTSSALILTGEGNAPVRDSGWPDGAHAVANVPTRVGWWEGPPFGGGEYHFDYRGNTEQFAAVLVLFTNINASRLEIVIHGDPYFGFAGRRGSGQANPIDWSFTVWIPERWHALYNNPKSFFASDQPSFRKPVAAPRIDVYASTNVHLEKIRLPANSANMVVIDKRAVRSKKPSENVSKISAAIYDISTGKAVREARLIAVPQGSAASDKTAAQPRFEAIADAKGHAVLEKIAGSYCFEASAPGYAARLAGYEQIGSNTLKNFEIHLSKATSFTGYVVDLENLPVSGAKVAAQNVLAIDGLGYPMPTRAESLSDADGKFTLSGLPIGWTQIWLHDPRFHYSGVQELFPVGRSGESNAVLRVSRTGLLRVSVMDQFGKPLTNYDGGRIMVQVEAASGAKVGSWGGSAEVNYKGEYEFVGIPPGEYKVSTRPNPGSSAREYAPPQSVKVEPNKKAEVRFLYPELNARRNR